MKENKTSWLGVLATEEVKQNGLKESNCVVNGAGNLQFYLRVISEIPNQERKINMSCVFRINLPVKIL